MEITARAVAKLFCTQRPSSSVEGCRSSCLLLDFPPVHSLLPLLHPSYLHLLGGKAWISPFPLSLALKRSLSPSHLAPLLSFPPLPCQTILCFYSKSFLPLTPPPPVPTCSDERAPPHSIILYIGYFVHNCADFYLTKISFKFPALVLYTYSTYQSHVHMIQIYVKVNHLPSLCSHRALFSYHHSPTVNRTLESFSPPPLNPVEK